MLHSLKHILGLNRAIGYGVLTRIWSAAAGPLTIVLIATRFSKVEQGYYYTFSSLLALQVFFELGLLTVLAQFAAHEFAFLSWGEQGEIIGNDVNRDRFLSLLSKGLKWYVVSAILLILILIPSGLWFFNQRIVETVDFPWRLPWVLAVIGIGGNLLLIPFYAVITGSGDVASINRREMLGGMIGSILAWLMIACGGGLYAIPMVTCGSIIVGVRYLFRCKPRLVKTALSLLFGYKTAHHTLSWWGEVWPMQWKIALSWVSGYFIFQLFAPILFRFHGPVIAGQMGMTMSVSNALLSACLTWVNVKTPEMSKLIAKRSWPELDRLFLKTLWQSTFVAMIGATLGFFSIYFLQAHCVIGNRFIQAKLVLMLFVAVILNVMINAFATYLRAHKQEPLLIQSLASAVLQGLGTWFLGKHYGPAGIVICFFSVTFLWTLPSVSYIWSRCRKNWHEKGVLI